MNEPFVGKAIHPLDLYIDSLGYFRDKKYFYAPAVKKTYLLPCPYKVPHRGL